MTAAAHADTAAPAAADLNAELMRFTQQLSDEVSGPPIELPSYPVLALRAQRALMEPSVTTERVVGILGSEPVLAARIVSLANSAAVNRSGNRVPDLRSAVGRLGFDALRTAAISFALAQLRGAPAYRAIAEPMKQLCETGVELAVLGCVVARATSCSTPDSAMLAGLVSGMGKLYILTRSDRYPVLFADPWTRQEMFGHWHAQVARSILANWQLAPEVIDAVAEIDRAATDNRVHPTLADVLSCAKVLLEQQSNPDKLAAALEANHAARRLALTGDGCLRLLADTADERAHLQGLLA